MLSVPWGKQPDEMLLEHGYGITDIVKVPRAYGSEPSDDEYRSGLPRILELIDDLNPRVLMFVYKRVLDSMLRIGFEDHVKSAYGFNPRLDDRFASHVFVFPMPGTPCTSAKATTAMRQLKSVLGRVV